MSNKLVVIDGNSIFYRSFYALPLLSNTNNEYSNAIYGFAIQILNIIQNIKPKYMVVAFDVSKKTFRNDLFDGYKATRKPMPDELRSQIEPLKKMLRLMDIKIAEKEGLEGDDIIGIISKRFLDTETIIVTGDRDSFQLVDDTTSVYFTKKGTSDVKIMGPKELKQEYGVTPEQFIDLKALQGDSSDNIPGVAGIGPKTATDLIVKFGSLDNVYSHLDEISEKLREKLVAGKEMAYLSKKLATIVTKGDIELSLKDLEYEFPFSAPVYEFFKHYEFKTLLKNSSNFDLSKGEKQEEKFDIKNYAEIEELQNIIKNIEKNGKFAIYFNKNEIHISYGNGEIKISTVNDLILKGINEFEFFDKFKPIFESKKIEKICFDAKQDMYLLKKYDIQLNNYFDCSVAKYLVDGVPVDSVKDVFFDDNTECLASKMFEFSDEYKQKIEDEKLQFLFYSVEIPLVKVLFSMENVGFKIDTDILSSLKQKYELELKQLENEIYKIAGEKFNINSPKQLAAILYEKLNLSHKKKQSTSAETLEEIKDEHEIVVYILRYRKVAKFLSTYISGIYPHIDKNNLVHTYFKQTFTTTGRLSSVEPNLQNIPIRSEESREIRSMFVASSTDNVLIDADYSQIELRLLAHLSRDEIFVNSFKNGEDIHTKTASTVFGIPENMVTKEMRRMVKVVNFGIIYGISEYGLADDLKISPRDARALINNFYEKHTAVKKFMDDAIAKAKATGKATTLFGRTRKMFDINASNFMVRSRAERASQNMPLQGTAADIIKIAMVNTFNALQSSGLKAKLIMQVHDELIIDAPKNEEKQVIEILKEQMENACKLVVPLEVDVSSSYRWSDGH
jgi:DNA polymerase-1